ncbi:hypothetical protein Q1W73_07720 [Asticcacaulis sp. ZE23SCel15]|uniref:hypothetical protein n=1 Tax=Asticcacaulis sp. ZE23SCel15 TaxID=3059027 RepID=UPI00265EFC6D|nr:hypothetical protein [Asticcacaulis sp. ZE23SCel15]WKL58865.1 hypothetical protein Q1W73_07720 [Asticcacaulis sp. ZE23SCel15]
MRLEVAILSGMQINGYYSIASQEPFSADSESKIITYNADYEPVDPKIGDKFSFFLDSEDLSTIFDYAFEKELNNEKIVEMAIFYAVHDAYPEWTNSR